MHRHGLGIFANKGIISVHASRQLWNCWGIIHVLVFLTPYTILNWIYFAVGRR